MIRSPITAGIAVSFAVAVLARAQTSPELRTVDTILRFTAGPEAPGLLSLQPAEQEGWTNRGPAALIDHAEANGQTLPLYWRFSRIASQTSARRVVLVYETTSPRLRLSWGWTARAARGPIEHLRPA